MCKVLPQEEKVSLLSRGAGGLVGSELNVSPRCVTLCKNIQGNSHRNTASRLESDYCPLLSPQRPHLDTLSS